MDVSIHEKKISLTSEYDIETPAGNYHARKAMMALNDKIEVTKADGGTVAHIQGHFSPLRAKHDIVFTDGRSYAMECEKLMSRVFTCTGSGESYTLYEHRRLRFSIFKGERQIAAIKKNLVVIGSGNEYEIQMDSDADAVLVACMVVTINSIEFNDDDNSVNVDFGNVGPQGRPFDENWLPK